nr:HAMP domain-containing histidine kinase [Bacteroidota bacterium]
IDNSRLFEKQNATLESLAKTKQQLSEINAEVSRKNDELIRINNDLDSFIYTASHDLKSPISNIEGLLYAISDIKLQEEEAVLPLLNMMNISVERFKNTIQELTEISKIQKLNSEDIEEIDLDTLLEEVKFSMAALVAKHNAVINSNFKVPRLRFSKKNLRSIFYNLTNNAIKYRSSERNPFIKLVTEEEQDFIKLKVTDNGLGISESNKAKVFSMFKRLHDHVEGTGVGLYIVKRVVENAGGKIHIESEVGKGTSFIVYFKK